MNRIGVIARSSRVAAFVVASVSISSALLWAPTPGAQGVGGPSRTTSVEVYDDFGRPGYSMQDYQDKWSTPYGPGEMALEDTRSFARGAFKVSAVPFRTGADYSVFDHLKYIAVSNKAFPIPDAGSVEISSTIKASTPGTEPGRIVRGTYVESGAPYAEPTLEGQQAGVVMNVIDFGTGQLFDWFVSGSTAFALIERLPSSVTGNASTGSPGYVGREKMYTQIIEEIPASPGAHTVSIRVNRDADGISVDYLFDGARVAHVDDVGVPLDAQGADYTGIYPSLGAGEALNTEMSSVVIGHGLFSLLDAFPFQHPEAPELSVSIPMSERLFGQGAVGTFDDFRVKTVVR